MNRSVMTDNGVGHKSRLVGETLESRQGRPLPDSRLQAPNQRQSRATPADRHHRTGPRQDPGLRPQRVDALDNRLHQYNPHRPTSPSTAHPSAA